MPVSGGGTFPGRLGGRPGGRLTARTRPRWMISPPQTPQGSARSTAPARHGPRSGHERQPALASSRSSGRSENHRCGLFAHGSAAPTSAASRSSEVTARSLRCIRGAPCHVRTNAAIPLCTGWPSSHIGRLDDPGVLRQEETGCAPGVLLKAETTRHRGIHRSAPTKCLTPLAGCTKCTSK